MANKKTTILFTLLLLGGSFLQSCSDEDEKHYKYKYTDPNGCYVTQEVIDDGEEIETITYLYKLKQIISASSVFQVQVLQVLQHLNMMEKNYYSY